MTVLISVASMLLSLALGILSAAGRSCRILVLRYLCSLYVTFIRGTPLIMQIYLFYYIVGTAWGIENRFAAGVLILSVFEGAYISEIIRGSLLSMDESQLEAAGIECVPELRGLGEYPAVASLLADAPFLPAESWNRNAEEKQ